MIRRDADGDGDGNPDGDPNSSLEPFPLSTAVTVAKQALLSRELER